MRTRSALVAFMVLATVGTGCVTVSTPTPPSTPPAETAAAETPTPTASESATESEAASPSESATSDQLTFSLDPNFGTTELEAGFTPDPYTVDVTSGGPIDASYLEGCNGWATAAPDYRVRYTAGDQSMLRFYFIPSDTGATTLIVNDSSGSWVCEDDTYDGLNPTVDIVDPGSGQYDIWIGSYTSDAQVAGTLYVSELDSNHP